MTDDTESAGSATQETAAPALRMVAHFVRDLSFENVAATEGVLLKELPEVEPQISIDTGATGENRYTISMKIHVRARTNETIRFIVELDYIGVFQILNVPEKHIEPFLIIECGRHLLPHAHRVISDVTRDGGYPPLTLETIDFAAFYRQMLAERRARRGNGRGDGGIRPEAPPSDA